MGNKRVQEVPGRNAGGTISRQAVIQMFNVSDRFVAESLRLCDTDIVFSQNEVFIVDDMYENLEQLPSAQPEIIRCRDCKFYSDDYCRRLGADYYETFFCGFAERREVEREQT